MDLDFEALASDWVRALRGKRSQAAFSRRLGYGSSVATRWESGTAWPTAARFLEACERQGRDVRGAYARFFQCSPEWLGELSPSSPAAVAALLQRLRGKVKIGALAEAAGYSRYAVARWLKGRAQPKLPEFLRLVQASSRRSLDFVACFEDPASLPSAAGAWKRLSALRRAAHEETWSHAVLRALELEGYAAAGDEIAWLSGALGVGAEQVARALSVLEGTGQIRRAGGRWVPEPGTVVTTGRDPERLGQLTSAWTDVAVKRVAAGRPSHFGYSLFAISRRDLRRLRELHLEYLREMQSIIARSQPNECVGLLCLHLLDLAAGDDNAFG